MFSFFKKKKAEPGDSVDQAVNEPDNPDAALPQAEPLAEPVAEAVTETEPEPEPEPVAEPVAEPELPVAVPDVVAKGSWLARLKEGLSRTGQSLGGIFVGVKVDEALFEELETALIMADAGVEATDRLLTALRARVRKEHLDDAAQVKAALRDILSEHLAPL